MCRTGKSLYIKITFNFPQSFFFKKSIKHGLIKCLRFRKCLCSSKKHTESGDHQQSTPMLKVTKFIVLSKYYTVIQRQSGQNSAYLGGELPFMCSSCGFSIFYAWFARFTLSLILTIVYVFHMEHHISCYVLMFRYSRLLLPSLGTAVIGVRPSCTSIVHLPRKMGLCYSEFTKHFDQYTIPITNVVILADFRFH